MHIACIMALYVRMYICTVQFNYNFTHAWYSMHGVPQVFACKIQKIVVCIIISMRQDVSLPKTTHGHLLETCHCHGSSHIMGFHENQCWRVSQD